MQLKREITASLMTGASYNDVGFYILKATGNKVPVMLASTEFRAFLSQSFLDASILQESYQFNDTSMVGRSTPTPPNMKMTQAKAAKEAAAAALFVQQTVAATTLQSVYRGYSARKQFAAMVTDSNETLISAQSLDSSLISNPDQWITSASSISNSDADTSIISNTSTEFELKSCMRTKESNKLPTNDVQFADQDDVFELQSNVDELNNVVRSHLSNFNQNQVFDAEKAHAVTANACTISSLTAAVNFLQVQLEEQNAAWNEQLEEQKERFEHKLWLLETNAAVQGRIILQLQQSQQSGV